MGILSSSIAVCQYKVMGDIPKGDLYEWIAEGLRAKAFRPLEDRGGEESVGWVHGNDPEASSFGTPHTFWHGRYAHFGLRREKRKVPGALLKSKVAEAERDFLKRNSHLNRVPKAQRDEIKASIRETLLKRALPVPAVWDVVWDTTNHVVTFTNVSTAAMELLEKLFAASFPDIRLSYIHPIVRAEQVVPEALAEKLKELRSSQEGISVSEQIKAEKWLGREFLQWLLFRTDESDSVYNVTTPGPADSGCRFVAAASGRVILEREREDGTRKVTVAGPGEAGREIRVALAEGFVPSAAAVVIEQEEREWSFVLRGDTFALSSFKPPKVRVEKGEDVDEDDERESALFERVGDVEEAIQCIESLLATFLNDRLREWGEILTRMKGWVDAP